MPATSRPGIGSDHAVDVAIVGDRLYTDMRMGRRAGLTTILVLSGETKQHDLAGAKDKPDYVFPSVRELAQELNRDP